MTDDQIALAHASADAEQVRATANRKVKRARELLQEAVVAHERYAAAVVADRLDHALDVLADVLDGLDRPN